MSAFINAYVPPDVDRAPWNWNPAETFLTAYTTMQEEKRAQEEFAIAQELDRYLLPMKKQQAELSLEKMNLEMEKTRGELTRQTILTRQMTDVQRNVNQGFNSGVANPTSNPGGGRYGSGVAEMIKSYQSGAAMPPSGGGSGGKILGTGLNP